MNKYRVMKDGRHVGDLEGEDARQVGPIAIDKWGHGMYDISLIRETETEARDCKMCGDPFVPGVGEDPDICEDCFGDIDGE